MSDIAKQAEPLEKDSELSKNFISEQYWDSVLVNGEPPKSVYVFCKNLNISEKDFYQFYSSFQAIEEEFWAHLISETREVLANDSDYQSYDSKGKMLAFFYTFFENSLGHRSKFLVKFPAKQKALCDKTLGGMRDALMEEMRDISYTFAQQKSSLLPAKLIEESYRGAWPALLYLIDFWIHDTSVNFQDTDSLIEKVVKLGDELTSFSIVDAAFDLAKFALGRGK